MQVATFSTLADSIDLAVVESSNLEGEKAINFIRLIFKDGEYSKNVDKLLKIPQIKSFLESA
jgi:hypothetical protein